MTFRNALTNKMAAFIRSTGIEVLATQLRDATFIPGIYISEGRLLVDEEKLLYPSDLLHEAGHIALIPSHLRKYATGDVGDIAEIGDAYEVESIAWSWAAALDLGIEPEILFHEHGYKGASQQLLMTYRMGVYIGLKRLEDYDMAYTPQKAAALGVSPFPAMQKWLRD
ncbi:MAG TPA: hypothetical protein VFF26_12480 [Gallionella sp.]|nr:hypothetical protein [Gallionella sp.]